MFKRNNKVEFATTSWRINFHFKGFPNSTSYGVVSAENKGQAIKKFKADFPNLSDCIITEVKEYEGD